MSEPVSLNAVRAQVGRDCRLWSPLEALKDTVARIERGELDPDMVFIAMREVSADGRRAVWPSVAAGGTRIEILGLLALHAHRDAMNG